MGDINNDRNAMENKDAAMEKTDDGCSRYAAYREAVRALKGNADGGR